MTTTTKDKAEHDAVTGHGQATKPAKPAAPKEPEKAQFVKMPEPRPGDLVSINEPPGSQVLPEGGDKPEEHAKQSAKSGKDDDDNGKSAHSKR